MSELTLAIANRILEAVFARAAEMGGKPLGAAVVGSEGNLIAFQRQDGASMFRYEIATGKAWGAVAMGISSRALLKRAQDNPSFITGLNAASGGRVLTSPGGVLILSEDGRILGAVGASGDTGDNDEAFVVHGIEAVGLKAGV